MSEVTKENMLFHLKHGCSFYPVCPICNAIRALITDYPRLKAKYDALRGKVTREEMRETLDYLVEGRQVGFSRGLATKHLEDCVDAICALIEHGPEVNEVSIELEVLKTERAGYEAENQIRLSSGEALAYGADAFQELAERMKGLNARVMVKEG